MVLGGISDVHANVIALEAALAALRQRGATTVICLGDLVGYGPSPNETIALLRSEGVVCTLGPADERIAFDFARRKLPRRGVADETLEWTRTVIDARNVEFLRSLPVQHRLVTDAGRFRFFHGTPETPSERFSFHQEDDALGRLLDRYRSRLLAAGGTHVPYFRRIPGGAVLNPGSVGLSLNGEPGADYAVIEVGKTGFEVVMDKVEYDFGAVAFDIVAWGLPQVVAEAVQQGRMPGKFEER